MIGTPSVNLKTFIVDPQIAKLVPEETARRYQLIPLFRIKDRLTIAVADPNNLPAIDEVSRLTGLEIETAVSSVADIQHVLDQVYNTSDSMDDLVKVVDAKSDEQGTETGVDIREIQRVAEEAPLVRLVNLILLNAIDAHASDIHIEPMKDQVRVRFRVDGVLRETDAFPYRLLLPIVARVKILADLDIIERRKPQDGRIAIGVRGRQVDLRVSTFPTHAGEKVVIRILDRSKGLPPLDRIGFPTDVLHQFQDLIHRPNGVILVTGPTGSGKTSTLYAALQEINTPQINIITLEDPVEYQLPGIAQGQVNARVGLTFADGLRSILRQDPNVILVGEIRDGETARIAIQASLTGHLVFSTLHTNDAPSTITRLVDLGVESFLISSSLLGVLAQRLVRCICPDCREETPADPILADLLRLPPELTTATFYKGHGCTACGKTGYRGRIGIFELLTLPEALRALIVKSASTDELREAAATLGMRSLRDDGLAKAVAGVTTLAEVLRVTQET